MIIISIMIITIIVIRSIVITIIIIIIIIIVISCLSWKHAPLVEAGTPTGGADEGMGGKLRGSNRQFDLLFLIVCVCLMAYVSYYCCYLFGSGGLIANCVSLGTLHLAVFVIS